MAKLPIRESRKGREGMLVRAQEANGEIRWQTYRLHTHINTHTHKHRHKTMGKTEWGCHIRVPAQTHTETVQSN